MESRRLLVFHPSAGLKYFSESLIFFVRKFTAMGYQIDLLGCDHDFNTFCNVYAAKNISLKSDPQIKNEACRQCVSERTALHSYFGKVWTLAELFGGRGTAGYRVRMEKIDSQIQAYAGGPIADIVIDGLPIGRMAAYEFILNNKIANIEKITSEAREDFFQSYFKNALKTLEAMKLLTSQRNYDGIFVYNSCYGSEHTASAYVKTKGQDAFFVHGGRNLEKMYSSFYFSRLTPPRWNIETIQFFRENYKSMEFDYSNYELPLAHFKALYASKSIHTYSSGASSSFYASDLWKKIPPARKVVLISLSSGDEFYAADFSVDINRYVNSSRSLFKDRFEWLQSLIPYFREHPDVLFIIRFHPREFPNKREKFLSPEVHKLQVILENLPANVHLNYPAENISIYNILPHIDLHLCGQSSVGFESAALGVPTVCYIDGIGNYPISRVAHYPETADAFHEALTRELKSENRTDLPGIRRAFEWLIYLHGDAIYNFESWGLLNPVGRARRGVKKVLFKLLGYAYQALFFYRRADEKKLTEFMTLGRESFQFPNRRKDPGNKSFYFAKYLASLKKLVPQSQDPEILGQHRVLKNLALATEKFREPGAF